MKKINRRERTESCACTGRGSTSAMQRGSAARPSLPPPPLHLATSIANTISAMWRTTLHWLRELLTGRELAMGHTPTNIFDS